MSSTIVDQLIEFAESGNQQKITLSNGTTLQGWIMEVDDTGLVISSGYGDKTGTEHRLSLEDLNNAELSYWDHLNSEWFAFSIEH